MLTFLLCLHIPVTLKLTLTSVAFKRPAWEESENSAERKLNKQMLENSLLSSTHFYGSSHSMLQTLLSPWFCLSSMELVPMVPRGAVLWIHRWSQFCPYVASFACLSPSNSQMIYLPVGMIPSWADVTWISDKDIILINTHLPASF